MHVAEQSLLRKFSMPIQDPPPKLRLCRLQFLLNTRLLHTHKDYLRSPCDIQNIQSRKKVGTCLATRPIRLQTHNSVKMGALHTIPSYYYTTLHTWSLSSSNWKFLADLVVTLPPKSNWYIMCCSFQVGVLLCI